MRSITTSSQIKRFQGHTYTQYIQAAPFGLSMIANLIQKVRNGTAAARHRPVYLLIICLSTLFIAAYLYITTPAGKFSWKSSHPEDYDDHPTYHAGDSTELAPISNPTDYTLPHAFSSQFPSLALPSVFLSHPKLYRRLHSFLSRPIYSHNYAIEHDVNSAGCPRELSDRLVNPDQLEGEKDFWRDEVDTAKIIEKRSEMVRYLEKVLKENDGYLDETHREYEQTMNKVDAESMAGIPNTDIKDFTDIVAENPDYVLEERRKRSPIPGRKTRGIVTTGGNADTTLRLITLLRVLRREHHSTLPVEVWHFPNELTDNNQRKEIESLGGEIKQIKGMEKQEGAWKNFQIKGLAIVQSSFQELIYLDSVSYAFLIRRRIAYGTCADLIPLAIGRTTYPSVTRNTSSAQLDTSHPIPVGQPSGLIFPRTISTMQSGVS